MKENSKPLLEKRDGILMLTWNGMELCGDFTRMIPRLKKENLNGELLVRAAKIKTLGENPIAVDCTAGLGEDSFLLAACGFRVYLFEYNPVIFSLLEDAVKRALEIPELKETAGRMTIINENSITGVKNLNFTPDLIYLDPMFPSKQKNSLTQKKLQMFQQLELPCMDEKFLLESAFSVSPKKIIIKRPLKGPFLSDIKPNYSISGKAVRYDCLVP